MDSWKFEAGENMEMPRKKVSTTSIEQALLCRSQEQSESRVTFQFCLPVAEPNKAARPTSFARSELRIVTQYHWARNTLNANKHVAFKSQNGMPLALTR